MRPSPFTASGCSRRAAARYHGRCRGFVWGSTMTARAVTALPAVLLAALLVALLPAPPARGTGAAADFDLAKLNEGGYVRSEENTYELQSLMRISYAVFCLKKKRITLTHKYKSH